MSHTRLRAPDPPKALFAEADSEIDACLDAVFEPEARASTAGRADDARDSLELRELFAQIAASYVKPVRDFMMELSWGDAPRAWIDICEPSIRAMRSAAEKLEHHELCRALDAFSATLLSGADSGEASITGELKDKLVTSYARLASVMPPAFELDGERSDREPIIIQSLLQQIPEVGKVTTDKLYAAGITSLEVLCMATAEDISFVTGISATLSQKIVVKFQTYRRDIESSAVDPTRAVERDRLVVLVEELRRMHRRYEEASAAWPVADAGERRRLRRARTDKLLDVNVLLARLGEVDRVRAIERVPYAQKIEAIEAYLVEAMKA